MLDTLEKDPAVAKTYSLRRSKHDAIRLIAVAEGHCNVSRVLDRFVEAELRRLYGGRKWRTRLAEDLADEEEEQIA